MGIKSVARAAWNGPFYIGPLQRPVSAGDAILKLFETVWRVALIAVIAFVVIVGAALTADKFNSNGGSPSGPLTMTVAYKAAGCHDPNPIAVYLRNNSSKPVEKYRWNITVKARGHSSDLTDTMAPMFNSDQIISPGQEMVFCDPIPNLTNNTYTVDQLEFSPGTYFED